MIPILCLFGFLFSKSVNEIHLENGSIIRGEIIENVINDYVKVKTNDDILLFNYSDITKILVVDDYQKIIHKKINGIVGVGIPNSTLSPCLLNIGVSFKVAEHSGISLYLGLPHNTERTGEYKWLTVAKYQNSSYGISYNYYKNFNDNGFRFSASVGQWLDRNPSPTLDWTDWNLGINHFSVPSPKWFNEQSLTFAYQLRSKKSIQNKKPNFWVLGIMINRFGHYGPDGEGGNNEYSFRILPTLSWEHRF